MKPPLAQSTRNFSHSRAVSYTGCHSLKKFARSPRLWYPGRCVWAFYLLTIRGQTRCKTQKNKVYESRNSIESRCDTDRFSPNSSLSSTVFLSDDCATT